MVSEAVVADFPATATAAFAIILLVSKASMSDRHRHALMTPIATGGIPGERVTASGTFARFAQVSDVDVSARVRSVVFEVDASAGSSARVERNKDRMAGERGGSAAGVQGRERTGGAAFGQEQIGRAHV